MSIDIRHSVADVAIIACTVNAFALADMQMAAFSSGSASISREGPAKRPSPFSQPSSSTKKKVERSERPRRKLIPKKYAVNLTPKARSLFKSLLENAPEDVVGIMFKYGQGKGSLGMAFSFGFARVKEIGHADEG